MYSPIIGPSSSFPCSVPSTSSARSLTGYGPCLPCQPKLKSSSRASCQSCLSPYLLRTATPSSHRYIFKVTRIPDHQHLLSPLPRQEDAFALHCIAPLSAKHSLRASHQRISTYLIIIIDPPISGYLAILVAFIAFKAIIIYRHRSSTLDVLLKPSSLMPVMPLFYYFEGQTLVFLLSIPGTSTSTWDTRDGDRSPVEVSGTSTSTQGRLGRRLYTCFITQGRRLQPGDAWGSDSSLMSNTGDIDQIPLEGRQYLPRNWRKITWIIL
jgi:hypothetical protein